VLDYLTDGVALPDDADIGIIVDAAGVDAYQLMGGTGRDTAAGVPIAGELAGGEDDGRPGLAGPGTAVDQERGQVTP
jgi:hypothetical protein